MIHSTPSDVVHKVITIAEEAGKILLSHYKSKLDIDYKGGDAFDPVTAADREADDFVRSELLKLFPKDTVLSEENEDIPSDYSRRVWMVDPLDGTKEFINHTDGFAVNIGLWADHAIQLGVVYAPALKRLFVAERGRGAFERTAGGNFKPLHVSNVLRLRDALLLTRTVSKDQRPLDAVVEQFEVKEKDRSSKIKICRIASGEADAHLNTNFRVSKWDTLASQLILEEAGGVISDIYGKPLDYEQSDLRWRHSFVAANNKTILDQMLAMLKHVVIK